MLSGMRRPLPPLSRRSALCTLLAASAGPFAPPWQAHAAEARGAAAEGAAAEGAAAEGAAAEQAVVRLGLALHVPREGGAPAVSDAFLERQLGTARRIFAQYGVTFAQRERHDHDGAVTRVETRAQRDSFAALVRPQLINVFAVASLMDVDEPGRVRRGVHWHARNRPPAHYVILSGISFDAVLAHELGHFLGNREHSQTPGNLMSYQHTDVLPFLDEAQQRRLHARVARYLRSGELKRFVDR